MRPILIVDDSAEDRLLAYRVFLDCKILNPIVLLAGGEECLEYFQNAHSEDLPALVMIDLAMPVSGVRVLGQLCGSASGAHSIFVMLSGLEDIKEIRQGYHAGARTFLVKPLVREDLLQLVDGLKQIGVAEEKNGYILSQRQSAMA
jgi:CheY-like chemotaxis protein